jgi:hypothetical protein
MTDKESNYLAKGKRTVIDQGPVENEGDVPAPFAGDEVDASWDLDQTMGGLDEALQAAADGGEYIAVDDPYDGESDAPGEPD